GALAPRLSSFSVPATGWLASRPTPTDTVWPGKPETSSTTMRVWPGGVGVGVGVGLMPPLTRMPPSLPDACNGRPPGVLANGLLTESGWRPSAMTTSMFTVHVYSTAPSGIGSTFSSDNTTARTPVQSTPCVHPSGWYANEVADLSIAGFTEHDTI